MAQNNYLLSKIEECKRLLDCCEDTVESNAYRAMMDEFTNKLNTEAARSEDLREHYILRRSDKE